MNSMTTKNSTQEWLDANGELHREDGPAVIHPNGAQEWYRHGELHRVDGPAVIHPNGTQEWYRHNQLHRDDGPAITYPDGARDWYFLGKLHREDGPAAIWATGKEIWSIDDVKIDETTVENYARDCGLAWPLDDTGAVFFKLGFAEFVRTTRQAT